MTYVETKDSRVVREIESKALLASNLNELSRTRATRSMYKKTIDQTESLSGKMSELETKLLNIERLLTSFLAHKESASN